MSNDSKSTRPMSNHGVRSQAEYVQSQISEMEIDRRLSRKSLSRVRTEFWETLATGEYRDTDDQLQLYRELLDKAERNESSTKAAQHAAAKAARSERRHRALLKRPKRVERRFSRKDHKASDKPAKHRDPVAA